MVLHFLPDSDYVALSLSSAIRDVVEQWRSEWFCRPYKQASIEIQTLLAEPSELDRFEHHKNCFWFEYVIRHSQLLVGCDISQRSIDKLLEAVTGYSIDKLSLSKVEWPKVLVEILQDLIISLTTGEQVLASGASQKLSFKTHSSHKISEFTGRVIKVKLGEIEFDLLMPNLLVKEVSLSGRNEIALNKVSKDINLYARKVLVRDIEVTLAARIDGFNIKLKDLRTLQVGDVLTTRLNSQEQISCYLNDKVQSERKLLLGKNAGNVAVKIQ